MQHTYCNAAGEPAANSLQQGRQSRALAASGRMTTQKQHRLGSQELMQPARRGYLPANRLSALDCRKLPQPAGQP